METKRLATWLVAASFALHAHSAFAGQGCCSTHGGVAGCAGAKLQCNDGTLSPTCNCHNASSLSISQTQDKLALMQAGTPEVKPIVTPTHIPSPTNPADVIPPREENQLGDQIPENNPQKPGDILPAQQAPKSYETPKNSAESTDYHSSDQSPPKQPTIESEPKSPSAEEKKQSTTGNMQKQVERGQAPKSVDRVDNARRPYEKDQVHFQDGSALNEDGTWKHGSHYLTRSEKEWLVKNG